MASKQTKTAQTLAEMKAQQAPAAAKKTERVEQNGIKRVLRGACKEVWDALDEAPETVTPLQCHDIAAALGQRVQYVQIVLRQWRQFNGLTDKPAPARKAVKA